MGDGDEGGRRSREREGGKEVPVWKTVEEGKWRTGGASDGKLGGNYQLKL